MRTEQADLDASSRRSIDDIQRLRAGLGGDGHPQLGTPVQLFGQVHHECRLAGPGRRGNHHGWIT